ncbi:MAG: type II toxin-antitoxin system death-on-curing family toxin [Candidatus Promineifilaceae bacterium]
MTRYLSPQQILFIHTRLIEQTGGSHGVRDMGLLESAAARPQATFDSVDLYPTLFLKTAALMASLTQNHPFVDGNKRTAITTAGLFLRRNGYQLIATNAELEAFTLTVSADHPNLTWIANWFETYSTTP